MTKTTGIFSTERLDNSEKLNIYYELTGASDLSEAKRLLVLLHDGLGSSVQWKDIPEKLAKNLNLPILNYDRTGYGKSSPVEERSNIFLTDEAECILPRLLRHLEFEGKAILFGHSDGATIALLYAALYPSLTECVIAEAPHVFIEGETVEGVKSAIESFHTGDLGTRLEKYHGKQTETMFWGWANFWSKESNRKWNMLSLLQRIESPVLYIQGTDDKFGTLNQGQEIGDRVMGDFEELIIDNCGHTPHFESKDIVLGSISNFLC